MFVIALRDYMKYLENEKESNYLVNDEFGVAR